MAPPELTFGGAPAAFERGFAPGEPVPSHAHGPRGVGSTPSAGGAGGPGGARVDASPCRATAPWTSPRAPGDPLVSTNNKCHAARERSAKLVAREAANPALPPPETAPRYVHACHANEWHLHLRFKDGRPGRRVPYRCNSRHHAGPCRDAWRRRLFARLRDGAMAKAQPCDVLFVTLTLPPGDHARVRAALASGDDGRVEHAVKEQNKALGAKLRAFTRALSARAERAGHQRLAYFWYREAHRSGVPHVHMIVVSEWLAEQIRERDADLEPLGGGELSDDDRGLAPIGLRELAQHCGFGERLDMQVARSREAMAGYATKVIGEVSKGSQTPEILPQHCRSYGQTRGFLAPPESDPNCTGWVTDEHGRVLETKRKPGDVEGGWDASGTAPRRLSLPDIEARPLSRDELAAMKRERLESAAETKRGGVWDADDVTVPNQGTVEDGWRYAETFHLEAPKVRTYTLRRRPTVYRPPGDGKQMELAGVPPSAE